MFSYAIHLEQELSSSTDQVWRLLTEPALLSLWLMETDFAPHVGQRFTFRATPMPFWDGIVRCQVREVEPPRRLAYSWIGSPGMPETMVVWQILRTATGTRLVLSHSGFRGLKYVLVGRMLKRGWKDMLARRLPAAALKTMAESDHNHSDDPDASYIARSRA
jgi:uncharacterized protein YndB with AHSA1/START domain